MAQERFSPSDTKNAQTERQSSTVQSQNAKIHCELSAKTDKNSTPQVPHFDKTGTVSDFFGAVLISKFFCLETVQFAFVVLPNAPQRHRPALHFIKRKAIVGYRSVGESGTGVTVQKTVGLLADF